MHSLNTTSETASEHNNSCFNEDFEKKNGQNVIIYISMILLILTIV